MYTRRNIRWSIIMRYGWKSILFFICYSGLILLGHLLCGAKSFQIPFLPIGVIGTAVAFYLGFKNNSSYDRIWEARRVWGQLVNSSRTFGIQALHFISNKNNPECGEIELQEIHRVLIHRHLAFLTALRIQLRRPAYWEQQYKTGQELVEQEDEFHTETMDKEVCKFLSGDEAEATLKHRNAATQLLKRQSEELMKLHDEGLIDTFHHVEIARTLAELYNQQGASERIKGFPFPRQYAYFSFVFTWLFILLLPFALIAEFKKVDDHFLWLVIPFHVLISWIFNTMEIVGASSENPFENGINDVPITTICRTIEIDLREMLGETELPPKLEPVHDILM